MAWQEGGRAKRPGGGSIALEPGLRVLGRGLVLGKGRWERTVKMRMKRWVRKISALR